MAYRESESEGGDQCPCFAPTWLSSLLEPCFPACLGLPLHPPRALSSSASTHSVSSAWDASFSLQPIPFSLMPVHCVGLTSTCVPQLSLFRSWLSYRSALLFRLSAYDSCWLLLKLCLHGGCQPRKFMGPGPCLLAIFCPWDLIQCSPTVFFIVGKMRKRHPSTYLFFFFKWKQNY